MNYNSELLHETVDFGLVGVDLGEDIEGALKIALAGGAAFSIGSNPLTIFQQVLAGSIRNIESHYLGKLFQKFLLKGPYEDVGEIPKELINKRLSDDESASVIAFIYSHMVNNFKGAVAELLAAKSCTLILKQLQQDLAIPANARLYIGDAVGVHKERGKGTLKGADQYILVENQEPNAVSTIAIAGVVEVKSYLQTKKRLREQLNKATTP